MNDWKYVGIVLPPFFTDKQTIDYGYSLIAINTLLILTDSKHTMVFRKAKVWPTQLYNKHMMVISRQYWFGPHKTIRILH